MQRLVLATVAVLVAGLPAASGTATAADQSATAAPGVQSAANGKAAESSCFWTRQVRNYTSDGRSAIYLDVGGRQVYRVDTNPGCLTAEATSDDIAFAERAGSGRVCNAIDIDVRIRGARCVIAGLTRLTPQEVAALPSRLQPTNLSTRPVHGRIPSGANAASNILANHGIGAGAFGPRPGGSLAGP